MIQLLLLTLASASALYTRTAIGPLQESIRTALHLSDNQIALLQGPAIAVPLGLVAIPLGLAIDRFCRVRLLFALMVLNVLGSVATAFAPNFAMLMAARCLIGATSTPAYLLAVLILADWYAPGQRGRATMIVTFGAVCGMSGAFALGGKLLSVAPQGSESWSWAMLMMSTPLIVSTILCLRLREPQRTGVITAKPSIRQTARELARYRGLILPLVAGLAMVVVADGASTIWAAPTLARQFDLPPDRIGAIVSLALFLSGVLGPALGGFLADYCQRTAGPVRTISALSALAFVSVPAGVFAITPDSALFTVLLVTFMTLGVAFNVAVPALITIVLPNELRGTCLTVTSATCMLSAFGIAPLAVSVLSGSIGGQDSIGTALATVCVTTSALGAAIFFIGRQSLVRQEERTHARQSS